MERLSLQSRYSAIESSIHLVRYAFGSANLAGARVLDAGCGEGYGTRFLAGSGVSEVIGLDVDAGALETAKELPHPAHCRFHRLDLTSESIVDAHGTFDSIFCIETLEHVSDLEAALRNIREAWNGKGDLIISWPNDPLYYGPGRSLNKHHLRSMAFLEARNTLENVLGPSDWFFGTVSNGFGIYEVKPGGGAVRNVHAGLANLQEACGVAVPEGNEKLTPSDALFYVGVWKGKERGGEVKPAVVTFPAPSDYRLPDFLAAPKAVQAGHRPKLVLVADIRDWAYHNIAKQISRHLGSRFNVEIVFQSDYKRDELAALHAFLFESKADFLHFFWRETILNFILTPWLQTQFMRRFSVTAEQLVKRLSEVTITASVYDHLFLQADEIEARRKKFSLLDGLSMSSRRLQQIYAGENIHAVTPVITDGVDLDVFGPLNLDRFDERDRELVVGWAGNSEWNAGSGQDRKGFHTIIKPALEALIRQGYRIRGHFADRNIEWRPHSKMAEYYAEIDVLICASEIEGTPNPVLEAAACGVPVVTTDVGIVDELLGPRQQQFILPERSVEALMSSLRTLHDDRSQLRQLSNENIRQVQGWTWQSRMPAWLAFFKQAEAAREKRAPFTQAYMSMMMQMRQRIDSFEAKAKASGGQQEAPGRSANKAGAVAK